MKPKIDWIIHCVANGVACNDCGKTEDCMLPETCNAHTHGMERYGHLDFQIVLRFDLTEICRILNTLGLRVQAGQKFKAGDLVEGIYADCNCFVESLSDMFALGLRHGIKSVLKKISRRHKAKQKILKTAKCFSVHNRRKGGVALSA